MTRYIVPQKGTQLVDEAEIVPHHKDEKNRPVYVFCKGRRSKYSSEVQVSRVNPADLKQQ